MKTKKLLHLALLLVVVGSYLATTTTPVEAAPVDSDRLTPMPRRVTAYMVTMQPIGPPLYYISVGWAGTLEPLGFKGLSESLD